MLEFKGFLRIRQGMIEAGREAWPVEKRQKKTPRKEGGDTRGPKALRLAGNRRVERNISKQRVFGKIKFEKNVRKMRALCNISQSQLHDLPDIVKQPVGFGKILC